MASCTFPIESAAPSFPRASNISDICPANVPTSCALSAALSPTASNFSDKSLSSSASFENRSLMFFARVAKGSWIAFFNFSIWEYCPDTSTRLPSESLYQDVYATGFPSLFFVILALSTICCAVVEACCI